MLFCLPEAIELDLTGQFFFVNVFERTTGTAFKFQLKSCQQNNCQGGS